MRLAQISTWILYKCSNWWFSTIQLHPKYFSSSREYVFYHLFQNWIILAMSSFILNKTLNVCIWLSKNIYLRLKRRVQKIISIKEQKLNHSNLWYGSNYLAPRSNVWLGRKHWFLTRPRFHDDRWLRRRWCGSNKYFCFVFVETNFPWI